MAGCGCAERRRAMRQAIRAVKTGDNAAAKAQMQLVARSIRRDLALLRRLVRR